MNRPRRQQRRFLAPEVVQTSEMDCGPAALKCLLEGHGIPISYGRLREACQTDVDGTSIDTLEEIAGSLGLEAEQIMLPGDHFLLEESEALPALVVVRQPNGLAHFVIVWRRLGPMLQIMDPGTGRRWVNARRFLNDLYLHKQTLPKDVWLDWALSAQFVNGLRRRMADLKVPGQTVAHLLDRALQPLRPAQAVPRNEAAWQSPAALDASIRMIESIARAGGLSRGTEAARLLVSLFERACSGGPDEKLTVPEIYWSVTATPPPADGQVAFRGVVLVRVLGVKIAQPGAEEPSLSPELEAALKEPPARPARDLWRLLRADGLMAPAALLLALAAAAGGVVFEALLFRGLFDMGRDLALAGQRLAALAVVGLLVIGLLCLELPITAGLLRLGRRLETRLRIAFLEKLPRLTDRYFQSRLTSDMAERCHNTHWLRMLPFLGGSVARLSFELMLTTVGLVWLDPRSAPLALLLAAASLGMPLLLTPVLNERDLRLRTHAGALSRFYLDALLGLVAVRAHGAERTFRSEHEGLVTEWARAGLRLQRTVVTVEGVQGLLGFGLAAALLFNHLGHGGEAGAVLLLIYWALNLPVLGQEIAVLVRQYPLQRSVTLRLLEPLGAPESDEQASVIDGAPPASASASMAPAKFELDETRSGDGQAVRLAFENVSVRVAGHTILEEINLEIRSGSHVAIVGPSGAGKSSLVGLLLGWHRAATGQVRVNGARLEGPILDALRQQTAWVDPTVQLWNRSLLANLRYGAEGDLTAPVGQVIEQAELRRVLEQLPDGLQTPLGEGGALVSGGEGQRVRFGRALFRAGVRLAILDEPFRGLDRDRRRSLLARARQAWRQSTLLCITHDVGETHGFDRVLVIENGRVVEDDSPERLASQHGSRYRALLESETAVREGLWSSQIWRRLRMEEGQLLERNQPPPA